MPKLWSMTSATKSRKEYNDAMKRQLFGYEEKSWHSNDQVETKRPISAPMKKFLDDELLESKIPDEFDKVAKLRELYLDLIGP